MKITIQENEENQRLDKFLRKFLKDVPLSAIYKNLRKKKIKVNGKKVKQDYILKKGDIIETYDIISNSKNRYFKTCDNYKLDIVYEDKNMLIVNKKSGILVHPDKKNCITLTDHVISYLIKNKDYIPEKEKTFTPSPCNRLDMNTCGLVIYGKNFKTLKSLNKMIRERNIKKYYIACIAGEIKDDEYKAFIVKDNIKNVSKVYNNKKEKSKKISMRVNTLNTNNEYSLIEIELITGKSHQLRAHLSHLNNPIVGDIKYGDKYVNEYFYKRFGLRYQFLMAYKLYFSNCEECIKYMNGKTIIGELPKQLLFIKNKLFNY